MKNSYLKTFSALFLIVFLVIGCKKKEENEPKPTMELKATIDGEPWEAPEFLVRTERATTDEDAHLWINAYDETDISQIRTLNLNIYKYTTPGDSQTDQSQDNRQEDCMYTITDIKAGKLYIYQGSVNFKITKSENKHYEGSFSGKMTLKTGPEKDITLQGSFNVWEGIQ